MKAKRIMSCLLALLMVFSVMQTGALSAFAETSGDYEYEVLSETDKTCEITDYTGSAANLTIPSEIDGYTVISIGYEAFYYCTSLTSVTIPNSVKSIGTWAFKNTAYYNNENNWENGVLYIGKHLIEAKETISGSYAIKSGTKTIADYAFADCTSLTSVTIPDSVTSIGFRAFVDCTSLTGVTIPNSITNIDNMAFYNCTSLTSINVEKSNMNYSSLDGVLFNKDKTEIIQYPIGNTITTYTIPDSVTSIGDVAFLSCKSLTSITIPDSVTSIGDSTFLGCTSLTNINIPDSVTSIGDSTFYNCTSLASITIPDSVMGIGDEAFYNCTSLASITIPDSVTNIGDEAFYNCTSLISITIPDSVTNIGVLAFYNCTSLTSITIPDSVTSIGKRAFGYYYDENHIDYKKIDAFTIYGYTGSAAETYAKENEFKFVALDDAADVSMHRLYNPNSGEHFYTANTSEKDNLVSLGWKYEGIGWNAPTTSSTPVYRLYNQNGGEHHYTSSASERDFLVSVGWKFEDIGWYSDDARSVPIYRQYNPNAFANNHNYTANKSENDWLVGLGWKAEGIGWYGVA